MENNNILNTIYDPKSFRKTGHLMIDLLADHLSSSLNNDHPVTNHRDPHALYQEWENHIDSGLPIFELLDKVMQQSINLHHPHYMGHQVTVPAPLATLGGLVSDFLNNGMGIYEMGESATVIERILTKKIGNYIGFDDQCDGLLTSGGTLANLTALLTARSQLTEENIWTNGYTERLAVMVSEEAHYCIDKAVRIMGLGAAGIIKIPVDDSFRIRTDMLEDCLADASANGLKVFAIVGSGCTTSTGTYDDLDALADFAIKHNLWYHVDGAHGGAAVFSEKYRHLTHGIARADSVTIDCHKMMMTPALATALVYKNGDHSFMTFQQKAQYLFEIEEQEWHNLAKRTFECTKYMMSLKFLIIWNQYGPQGINEYVTSCYDLGHKLAALINNRKELELAVQPDGNIVCFRYVDPQLDVHQLNELNLKIRNSLLEEGRFYIVKTMLHDRIYLRCTLMNPFTTTEMLQEILDDVVQKGR